jgi:PhnB protein
MVQPIPDGYPRLSPYLVIDGADAAIGFYKEVLGATERMRMDAPGGRVGHAELEIGDSVLMLADPFPEMDVYAPKEGSSAFSVMVYVEDVDAVFQRALDRGAKTVRPVEDQFYGDRLGAFEDPFGHRWNVATHVEDVPPEEMGKRAAEAAKQAGGV